MTSPHAAGAEIAAIYRYPVKGLSADRLDRTALETGKCIAFDRAYAIENGGRGFDPLNPQYLPKSKFLMLMSHEKLATLETRFDDQTQTLQVLRDGKQIATGKLDDRIGRQLLEQFFGAYMADAVRGAPRIVHAPDHSFSDAPAQYLSVINLASVRDLERVVARPVDPLRFRGNIYVEGLDPWVEFDWIGGEIASSGVPLFRCVDRIDRCAATNVDPATGARDMSIPRTLMQAFGHMYLGVFLEVIADGSIAAGDSLSPSGT
ncbi:MAG: MOSC domain-containing protein [Hyphomicrobiales bacterium]